MSVFHSYRVVNDLLIKNKKKYWHESIHDDGLELKISDWTFKTIATGSLTLIH